MTDKPFALCTRCGKTCPAATPTCSSCGAELGDETVFNDIHAMKTAPLGALWATASTSQTHTSLFAETSPRESSLESSGSSARSSLAELNDEEIGHVTAEVPRRCSVVDPAPTGGSSSDPPTRFLRGIDQHIELPSGSVVDDFEVDAKIGVGAMGTVYSARDARLGRRVALKALAPSMVKDPQALARFEREARVLATLHHANIVDVYAFGTLPDQRSYFAMEYLVGETLYDRLKRGRVPLDEALDIIDQISHGLEAAHAQGIVHRDLKPENTFLVRLEREPRSIVKLLDFGLSKLSVADGVEDTASGAVIGTPLYLSPEQARGPDVDHRTDIYALGCVAYELVLGRHPFPEARTPTAAIAAHLTEPPPQPRTIWPGIPAALDLLMSSMLAKDPSYRPTLAQVRSVVVSVRSGATSERTLRTVAGPTMRRTLHVRAWMAALVALTLVIGILIGARFLGDKVSSGNASSMSPVGIDMQNSGSAREAPALVVPEAPMPAVAKDRVLDAGITPRRPPATNSTRSSGPKPRIATTTSDAAVPDASLPEPIDAEPTPDADSHSLEREAPTESDAVKPKVTRPIDKPATRLVPQQPLKPPGRDDVVNPFTKRGSATR